MEKILILVVLCFLVMSTHAQSRPMRVGGISDEERVPDSKINEIVSGLSEQIKKSAAETMGANSVDIFEGKPVEPLAYKTQLVAGTNYFIRIRIHTYIFHVRIYQPLPHTGNSPVVSKVIGPKSENDPIEYF